MTHQSGDRLFIVPHFPLVIFIQSSLKIWGNVTWQICRNVPKKDSFAAILYIANHGLLDFSTCSYCCLAKDKVCSCDRKAALVQIKF